MSSEILGWIMIAIGMLSTMLGIAGGIVKMIGELDERSKDLSSTLSIIKALTEFLKVLRGSPTWLALTVVGVLLVVLGVTLIN